MKKFVRSDCSLMLKAPAKEAEREEKGLRLSYPQSQ